MSKGAVYKKKDTYWLRFVTPAGDRVDRPAHTADEQQAQLLLQVFTALTELCYLYAVPFDPDDTLPDIAHELAMARDEVEHVFGQIRCPHCSRRIVPEWRPEALEEKGAGKTGPKRERVDVSDEQLAERIVRAVVKLEARAAPPVPDEQFTERVVYDIVQGVIARLEVKIRQMVVGAVGPSKPKCVTKKCKDFAFAKGLCRKHYYRNYHAKRVERERDRVVEGK